MSQLRLDQCAEGASGAGESAAGGRGARAADADNAQWSELPLYCTSGKPNLEIAATPRNRDRLGVLKNKQPTHTGVGGPEIAK
jgi:hypothetical protein